MQRLRLTRPTSALAVLAVAATVAGCSAQPSTPAPEGCSPADVDTISDGVLTVGVPTFAPFTEVVDGAASGVDGDIITAFAEEACLGLEIVPLDYTALIPGLQQDRIDVAIGSIYRTEERAEQAGITVPLYLDQMGLISEGGVSTLEQLQDQRVGAIDGNLWVEDLQQALDGAVTLYPSSVELQADLEAGRLDVAVDSYGAAALAYADTDFSVEVIEPTDAVAASTEPGQTSFYYPEDAESLGAALDEELTVLRENGTIAEILEKWGLDGSAADTGEPRFL